MFKNLGTSAVALLLLEGTTFGYASDPTIVTWQDNFEGATVGQGPSQMPGWTGSSDVGAAGPWPVGWTVVDDGGNKVVRDRVATSATSGYSYAWTDTDSGLGLGAYNLQMLHFKARQVSAGTTGQRQQQVIFQFVDSGGNPIGGWRLTGQGYTPVAWDAAHSASAGTPHIGPTNLYPDTTTYHDYDMHWNKATETLQWFFDGTLVDTFVFTGRGSVDAWYIQWDNNAAHNDEIYYDDVKAGTPEPTTVLLLSLGALPLLRRGKKTA